MKLDIYIDGGARGNPGPAGIGVVIKLENGIVLQEYKEYIGEATNNVAEYRALIEGLKLAKKYAKEPCSINFFTDSELIYNQVLGNFKIKNEVLKGLCGEAQGMLAGFENVNFNRIPRELNKSADKLVNQALNIAAKKER
jgi:ribonuclease HI